MLISDLDAVNGVLRELGEQPLTTLDSSYPTIDAAQAALNQARLELLERGWWFNTIQDYTISLDNEGKAKVPDNTLEFIPSDMKYLWSGQYIMTSDGNVTFDGSETIKGTLKFDMPLAGLPYVGQQLVVLNGAIKVYVGDFGPDSKYQEMMLRARDLYNVLAAQHVRAKHPTMRKRPAVQEYYRSLFT